MLHPHLGVDLQCPQSSIQQRDTPVPTIINPSSTMSPPIKKLYFQQRQRHPPSFQQSPPIHHPPYCPYNRCPTGNANVDPPPANNESAIHINAAPPRSIPLRLEERDEEITLQRRTSTSLASFFPSAASSTDERERGNGAGATDEGGRGDDRRRRSRKRC